MFGLFIMCIFEKGCWCHRGSARVCHLCDFLAWSHVRRVFSGETLPSTAGFRQVLVFPRAIAVEPCGVALNGISVECHLIVGSSIITEHFHRFLDDPFEFSILL